jgi:hypothetical protein
MRLGNKILSHIRDRICGLKVQRSEFDSRRHQILWKVAGLERGPLCLVSTSQELLGRKSSGYGLENREYGRRDPSRRPRGTLHPQKLALSSPTSGGLSVCIVRSGTQATVFSFSLLVTLYARILVIGFIEHSQVVATSNYKTLTNSRTLLLTTTHADSLSVRVFTSRCLVAALSTMKILPHSCLCHYRLANFSWLAINSWLILTKFSTVQ